MRETEKNIWKYYQWKVNFIFDIYFMIHAVLTYMGWCIDTFLRYAVDRINFSRDLLSPVPGLFISRFHSSARALMNANLWNRILFSCPYQEFLWMLLNALSRSNCVFEEYYRWLTRCMVFIWDGSYVLSEISTLICLRHLFASSRKFENLFSSTVAQRVLKHHVI